MNGVRYGAFAAGPHFNQHIDMKHRNSDPDSFAILATVALWLAAAAALLLPACSPVGEGSGPGSGSGGPGGSPDAYEQEPNDTVTTPDRLPLLLTPGSVLRVRGTLGGDTINANGHPGTRDWFRIDAAAPCTCNVRVWIDGIGFVQVALVEWEAEGDYRLVASDHSGSGYIEQTVTVAGAAFGSGLGIGILESSLSADPGTVYDIEVSVW